MGTAYGRSQSQLLPDAIFVLLGEPRSHAVAGCVLDVITIDATPLANVYLVRRNPLSLLQIAFCRESEMEPCVCSKPTQEPQSNTPATNKVNV